MCPAARQPQWAFFRGDLPNLASIRLRKPDRVTLTRCNELRPAGGGRDRELGDNAPGGDAPNLVPHELREAAEVRPTSCGSPASSVLRNYKAIMRSPCERVRTILPSEPHN